MVDDCRAGVEIIWCHNEAVRLSSESLAHQSVCWSRQTFGAKRRNVRCSCSLIRADFPQRWQQTVIMDVRWRRDRGTAWTTNSERRSNPVYNSDLICCSSPTRMNCDQEPRDEETHAEVYGDETEHSLRVNESRNLSHFNDSVLERRVRNTFVVLSDILHRMYLMDRHESGADVRFPHRMNCLVIL